MNKKLIFFKKSALIFICTFLFPSISYAEYNWEKIGSNLSGTTYFVDTSSIKRNGKFVRYLRMADYFGIVFMRLVMLRADRLLNTVWKI